VKTPETRDRSLAESRRRLLVLALAVAAPLAALVPLVIQAWRKEVFAWDESLSKAIHAYQNRETFWNEHFDVFDLVLSRSGQLLEFLLVGAVFLLLLARGRLRGALFVALGFGGATVLGVVLKEVFAQPPPDPNGTGSSFPSGHALRSMAAAAILTALAWPTRLRWPVVVGGGVVVVLIGIAVVYHEWHWASDALAGWLLAIAWVGCVWLTLSATPNLRPSEAGSAGSERRSGTRARMSRLRG
jgi:membrane-associated phospholipid phosphatase